jgi:hypothetical protein
LGLTVAGLLLGIREDKKNMARVHAVRLGWEGYIDFNERDVRGTRLNDLEDCGLAGP